MDDWVRRLLTWYRANCRQMPWRGHPDPYAVWLSEIMLQQTQVDTVRPYFTRFLEAFPTISDLAAAEDEPLLKAWEGLGYYTRARNLRKAAQIVTERFGGELPKSPERLRELPGIGDYTAAAVASICFGVPEPVVDGNVARVFARFALLEDDFSALPQRRSLAERLRPHIVASDTPSEFNQAMMELGALVCTPRRWTCEACPLRPECKASALGCQSAYPKPKAKKALPLRKASVLLLRRPEDDALLLAQHTGERLLGGFWELPDRSGCPIPTGRPRRLMLYRQTFSHFRLEMTVLTATLRGNGILPDGGRFRWAADPSALPLTTATRKILTALKHND